MMDITYSVLKDDSKVVIGYDILADGVVVGRATKGEKGKFDFTAIDGAAKDESGIKSMKELKAAVGKTADEDFVAKVKSEKKAATKAAEVTSDDSAGEELHSDEDELEAEGGDSTDGDIDLD